MENTLTLTFGLMTASAMTAGGYWVAYQRQRWLTAERLRGVMALGAGFMLALALLEFLPAALEGSGGEPHGVLGMTLLGALTVLTFDRWVAPRLSFLAPVAADCCDHHPPAPDHGGHSHHVLSHGATCTAIGCLVICSLFDGVALSGALSGGTRLGALAMMGLLLHLLPEGVLAATVTMAGGGSPRNARRAALAMGLAFLVGTTLPLVLGPLSASALPFSAGVLLYVALTELIPSVSTSGKGAGLVLAGSAGYFLLEQLAHRLV